jgi:hypothetical protein
VSDTPSVDIILSHTGGMLPFLSEHAWCSLLMTKISNQSAVDSTTAIAQFRNFYYDIATNNVEYVTFAATNPAISSAVLSANADALIQIHSYA